MNAYDLDTYKVLDRYRFGRSNMIAALHGTSMQHRKRDLGHRRREGFLSLPIQQKESANYRYSPRVYELTEKARGFLRANGYTPHKWEGSTHFWHQLMIADLLISLEIECKARGLSFRSRKEIIGNDPLSFPCSIAHQFPKHTEQYDVALQPDELFAINDTYFVLEADRQTEPIVRPTLKTSSYLRKILQYRAVLKSGSYKTLIPNMVVLNVTTSNQHAKNIRAFMLDELKMSSSSLLFDGIDILGSRDQYPEPLKLLDKPLARVGHPDFVISQEVTNGRTTV